MTTVPQPTDDHTLVFDGRTFARFSLAHNTYCLPVDQVGDEEERCDALNKILRTLHNGRAVLVPFPPSGVDDIRVLDCGFGKGAWIEDCLAEYQHVINEVTGVDIFLGEDSDDEDEDEDDGVEEFRKKRWNLNAPFSEDRDENHLRREEFNLINSRFLAEGIDTNRWQPYIRELKELLEPGGWIQLVELDLRFQSDNGRLDPNSGAPLVVWNDWYRQTMVNRNKDPRVGQRLHQYLQVAGFQQVWGGTPQNLEIGSWNTRSSEAGRMIRDHVHRTLETVLLWPCAGTLRQQPPPLMSIERYRAMVRAAQEQLRDESLRLYYQVCVSIGIR
ncbi:hypothetical protein LTR56_023494 [Elasticomyces elasticus]|nr:hypothetical protein LTR56_023494 [Elasticomyces elasticus]KAK3662826.1 hypothetical protein LTR22_006444 [Elasticomyces elasticus]KAK4911876.1 hypothetical protein LTR49_019591 [Elasticomyces elasticus]KAK5765663.1 hypothetical protein LTS12_004169 [Elasticomyces elasticus]